MSLKRLLSVPLAILASAMCFAQFSSSQKDEVLQEIDHVLSQEAFVPGVDLGQWRKTIDANKEQVDAADDPGEFAGVVNGALKKLGLSHIILLPGRSRHGWGDETLVAQRGFGGRSRAELSWLDDDAALLRIPSFERGYDPVAIAELMDEAKSAKYLVVDLRGNPGGEVDNMRQFLGLVMPPEDPIGTFVSRSMATDYAKANGSGSDPVKIALWAHREFHPLRSPEQAFGGKIAVLVDGHSASASEIVASTLREELHSPIVGEPSMGAVLVSTFDRLSYGFRLQFPVGDYVTHGGLRLEGHPLKPDVSATGDAVPAAALRKLRSGS